MMTIKLEVNGKLVKKFDVKNVHPQPYLSNDFGEECPYIIWDNGSDEEGDDLGFVLHERKDGIIALARDVLSKIRQGQVRFTDPLPDSVGDVI